MLSGGMMKLAIVFLIAYFIGAKFPGLAQKTGLV